MSNLIGKFAAAIALAMGVSVSMNAQNLTVTQAGTYDAAKYPVGPGGTIYIKAGNYTHLRFVNYKGSATAPIRIINEGGQVTLSATANPGGLIFYNSRYFKVTGTGDPGTKYGIKIAQTAKGASGLNISNFSSDCEVERVEVAGAGFAGMMMKTDPNCNPSTWQNNFTMYNVSVHDNYIHDVQGEGLYIGNSFYHGMTVTCEGVQKTVYPHKIMGLKIYNNLIERAGCEGIQYACAPDADVHHNVVRDSGKSPFAAYQNNGIQIGGGAGGRFYNNTVKNTPATGLIILGPVGNNVIYNNLITDSGKDGIFCDDRPGSIAGAPVHLINNTVVNSKANGINIYTDIMPVSVINNAVVVTGTNKPITKLNASVTLTQSTNYTAVALADAKFVNPYSGDFRPGTGSPLIGKGQDVSSWGITYDLSDQRLVSGTSIDIGAFQNTSPLLAARTARLGEELLTNIVVVKAYPSPCTDQLTVKLSNASAISEVAIVDQRGRTVINQLFAAPTEEARLSVTSLPAGLYLLRVVAEGKQYVSRILKQ